MATKARTFRKQFDPKYSGSPGIENKEPSLTVPSMSIGIKKLLLNHARGISGGVQMREAVYTDDMEVPVFEDLVQAREYKKMLETKQLEVQREIDDLAAKKRAKEVEEAREAAKEALRAEIKAEEAKKKGSGEPVH